MGEIGYYIFAFYPIPQVELTGKVMSQSAIKEKYAALAGQVSSGMKRTVINLSRASADAKKAKMENAAPVREIQWEERTTAELPPEILADLKKLLGHIQMVGEEAGTVLKKL
jgi:hypothetical protein